MIPEPVRTLATVWSEWSHEPDFPYTRDHCINGTRVAVETLRHFGIKAKPLSVVVLVFNQTAWDLFKQGVPVTEWPPHAWSVGIDQHTNTASDNRFAGHLVAHGDTWLLDISAGQFHRPGLIHSPDALVLPVTEPIRPGAEGWWDHTDEHHNTWLMRPTPHVNDWRTAGGWTRIDHDVVKETITRIEARQ